MTRMMETKSVKVDNWGVFFLQKLQNFFNKTDHCDLTLQFNDNSQLKVHRLVLCACTDYFNMLENTCEVIEDVLIMPLDLQADVIVPIVNFMYTGTLEFQYNMYEKLLKTAKDMNMTVLLKLLEAHRQTTRISKQPVLLNKQAPRRPAPTMTSTPRPDVTFSPASVSRGYGSAIRTSTPKVANAKPVYKHHQTTIAPLASYSTNKNLTLPEPITIVSKYSHSTENKSGPSRFDATDENVLPGDFEGSFDPISYESKPLVTADQIKKEEENSPFEKLRKGYTNVNLVKRPAQNVLSAPVAKKPNLQDVKEFTEAARLRKQLETEATDDDPSDYVDDDTHFNDDDDDDPPPVFNKQPTRVSPTKTYGGNTISKQIVIKQEPNTTPPSTVKQITVKDDSGNVDHAKIISEVLKKYPHLVKKNKNIKLKIMQKTSPGGQSNKMEVKTSTPLKADMSMVRKATTIVRQAPQTPTLPATSSQPPKKIDSKTMHALIEKGAENMHGPWLCLKCGINGRPISIPSYKAFRNHLIVKHKEKIDARICEHCGWKASQRNPILFYHWLTDHNIKSTVKFPKCDECDYTAMTENHLQKHIDEMHNSANLQQCIYCNKVFEKEMDLYQHMKSLHREKARDDGVVNFSDDEDYEESEKYVPNDPHHESSKIKILSNISLTTKGGLPFLIDPSAQTVSQIGGHAKVQHCNLEPSSEAEALSNVASGIATSLGLVDNNAVIEDPNYHQNQFIEDELATVHGEFIVKKSASVLDGDADIMTKLITEDGTELELTQSQKDEIISQLQGQNNGNNVVMVLNQDNFNAGATLDLGAGAQLMDSVGLDADQQQNIVVVYSQSDEMLKQNFITSSPNMVSVANTESIENIENELSQLGAIDKKSITNQAEAIKSEVKEAASMLIPIKKEDLEVQQSSIRKMEVDMENEEENSADLSESPEVIHQIIQQESDDSKLDETNEDEEELIKAETEKLKAESEKMKLISELEGDWSEDGEEKDAIEKTELPQKDEITPDQLPEKILESESDTKMDHSSDMTELPESVLKSDKDDEITSDKNIDKLLDEWNNENKQEEIKTEMPAIVREENVKNSTDADDSLNDSDTKILVAVLDESETEPKTGDECYDDSDVKHDTEADNNDENSTDAKEIALKSKEVNTLLGDWDEEDEDL